MGQILDMGAPGTSRRFRMVVLKGVSQAEMGRRCKPKLPQATISQFDNAEHRLNWPMARRLAHAYAEEMAAKDLDVAAEDVWRMWFANVEAYGSPEMKRQARAVKDAFGFDLPLLAATAKHAPAAVEQLGSPLPAREAVTG